MGEVREHSPGGRMGRASLERELGDGGACCGHLVSLV